LEFIKAKYFGREMGVPELSVFVEVEEPLDSLSEGPFPFEEIAAGGDDEEEKPEDVFQKFSVTAMNSPLQVKAKKRVPARRVSVSSSESDGDITEVLREVVRNYTTTHSRSTRPAERTAETHARGGGMWEK
jgi:hypothetical protein